MLQRQSFKGGPGYRASSRHRWTSGHISFFDKPTHCFRYLGLNPNLVNIYLFHLSIFCITVGNPTEIIDSISHLRGQKMQENRHRRMETTVKHNAILFKTNESGVARLPSIPSPLQPLPTSSKFRAQRLPCRGSCGQCSDWPYHDPQAAATSASNALDVQPAALPRIRCRKRRRRNWCACVGRRGRASDAAARPVRAGGVDFVVRNAEAARALTARRAASRTRKARTLVPSCDAH